MNLLSTDNSFYQYDIKDSSNLSESCFNRRKTKSQYNNKKSFFYCMESSLNGTQLVVDFLTEKMSQNDVLCCTLESYLQIGSSLSDKCLIVMMNKAEEVEQLSDLRFSGIKQLLFNPRNRDDLGKFADFYREQNLNYDIYWRFTPFSTDIRKSLTVQDICATNIDYRSIAGLEIFNPNIPEHYELVPQKKVSYKVNWTMQSANPENIRISIIIPTYNNAAFLSNVVWHLINQDASKDLYEIIIADDGSTDNSSEILFDLYNKAYANKSNIKYIYWGKQHPVRGEQNFFRPGLARNLAAHYSVGKYLFFLDSDMLVPEQFINTCLEELKRSDIIQFQRFHIEQTKSLQNPTYQSISTTKDVYIEEKSYWSQLFYSNKWSDLPDYWKYTCTYALGIEKNKFYEIGLFKKYYISYGFEDTDIGYEAFKRNYRFSLIKTPLLHLTSYDLMQYKNSVHRRYNLLKVTAELFFLQHLKPEIHTLFESFYRSQRPLKVRIKEYWN